MTHSLSPMERQIFDLLPENGEQVTSADLADKVYNGRESPKHPRIVVMGAITRLKRVGPIDGFQVHRSPRAGQWPVKIWKERLQ